jgi:MoaA/NifB/PqqE/SkfB family radical SAM enzyme
LFVNKGKAMPIKHFRSPDYNYSFDTTNGNFARWGRTVNDDPMVAPFGPEIFDLEVSTMCSGIPGVGPCKHCYKSNTPRGENMSFETFKKIFNLIPKTLTQIAFGIGDLDANPDLVKMFDYCRNNDHNPGVVPNLTIHGGGLTDEWVQTLAKYCGGIAVSQYQDKDLCYGAVERLYNAGLKQVNIHKVIAEETLDECMQLIDDAKNDPRLANLKAIVFLTLKPKGKRNKLNTCKSVDKYKALIQHAFKSGITIGFDSCSAPTFLMALKDDPNFEQYAQMVDSCESDRMSGYANVQGEWWHCSFTEDHPKWKGINLLEVKDFLSEVWNSPEVLRFRDRLLKQDNSHICGDCVLCPVYDLYAPEIGNASDPVQQIIEVKAV